MKKLFALVLAVAMVLSLASVAMAKSALTVTKEVIVGAAGEEVDTSSFELSKAAGKGFASIEGGKLAYGKTAYIPLGLTKADAYAFGDGTNDLEMIRACGCGVAMGNAEDAVKAEANLVCAPVWEDGVAQALRELF